MRINTTRFGEVNIEDDSIIRLARGLLGFEAHTAYCLIAHPPNANYRWLQSVDEPSLAFLVADPHVFFPDYEIRVPESDSHRIGLKNADDAAVLVIISLADEGNEITANLAAPIVVNTESMAGIQAVLQEGRSSVRRPLPVSFHSGTPPKAAAPARAA